LTDYNLYPFQLLEFKKNVVEVAKECGITYIAYTSINAVDSPKFGLEINHGQTEK